MTKQVAGFFLSVPQYDGPHIITRLADATSMDEAREDAIEAGHIAFMAAGYEDMDMCFATLYQIAPSGGLAHSECFEIYGPEAC